MLTVRLEPDIEERLNTLATLTNRSKSFYIREALNRSLEDMEDVYLAESALEQFRSKREKAIPLEVVMSEYGMEN